MIRGPSELRWFRIQAQGPTTACEKIARCQGEAATGEMPPQKIPGRKRVKARPESSTDHDTQKTGPSWGVALRFEGLATPSRTRRE